MRLLRNCERGEGGGNREGAAQFSKRDEVGDEEVNKSKLPLERARDLFNLHNTVTAIDLSHLKFFLEFSV